MTLEATEEMRAEEGFLQRLRGAEAEACAELSRRFGPLIHRFAAARLGGDGELAEDVMVQTLTDAVRNLRQFDPRKSSLAAWLLGIARRQVLAERRKQSRQKSVPAAAQINLDAIPEVADAHDLAGDTAARVEAQRKVATLASVLSDLEFDALVLTCFGEFSAREVGRIVGRSERAIHSLLHRARQKARERLAQNE